MAVAGEPLMLRMAAGDKSAFDELLDGFQGAAYRFAYRIFRDRHIAEDVSQDFIFKLYRNAHKFQPQGRFKTYFYTVLNNLCLDTLRRMNRKSLPDFHSFENHLLDAMPIREGVGAPDAEAELNEERRMVRESIAKLPDAQRQVIVLRELEQLKYREIAEVLGLSLNEVKVLIHRGRKTLVKVL